MPQHPSRRPRLRVWAAGTLLVVAAPIALAACAGEKERELPPVPQPVAADLTAPQIITEASRALATTSSVRVRGDYKENGKPVTIDMRLAAGSGPNDDRATGVVTQDGVRVELRRIGDQIYLKGDDRFLEALGPQAQATKGKWLKGPVAQADKGLANLTDLDAFAATLSPQGQGKLTKEAPAPFAGQPAVSVLSSTGARLYVANTNRPNPLRIQRIGQLVGVIDFTEYDAPVDVKAPSPTVELGTVTQ